MEEAYMQININAPISLNISLTDASGRPIIEALNNLTIFDNCRWGEAKMYAFGETEAEVMKYKYKERVTVGIDASGKPIAKWAVGNTRAALQEGIARLKGAPIVIEPESVQSGDVLFGDYARNWMETYRRPTLKDSTFVQERYKINKFISVFGDQPICSITPDDVQRFLNTMRDNAKSYVRDMLCLLRKLFDAAEEDRLIADNPARSRKVKNPAKGKQPPKELTEEERKLIKEAIPRLTKCGDRMCLALLFYTGMRPEELIALRWEDIDGGIIHVQRAASRVVNEHVVSDTKTENGRRNIPLLPALAAVLEPVRGSGYLLHDKAGGLYTHQMQKRMWERIRKEAGLPKHITQYHLRHNFATMMAEAGVNEKAAQALMGHASPSTTMTYYQHPTAKLISEAGDKMQEAFSSL